MCLNNTYSKICAGEYFLYTVSVQSGLKQVDASFAITFQLCFRIAIRLVQENQVGLKLNGTHQHLVFADDVILLGDNIHNKKHRIPD
jgi:hypothetical protein